MGSPRDNRVKKISREARMKTAPDEPVRPLDWGLRDRSVADRNKPGYDHSTDSRCLGEIAVRDSTEPAFSSEGQRWEALLNRDQRADGAFLYAVRSTGVYCRPTCSSRRPKRENVVFFANFSAAEAAGFRPCKRCSPRDASADEGHRKAIIGACELIEKSEEHLRLKTLAAAVGLSSSGFHRLFKEIVGVTPKEYATTVRMNRLRRGLVLGSSITQTIYDAGFSAISRFYERSRDTLGMTPSAYKRGGAGLRIRVAVASSFLGWVLVAATDHGICAIDLGDTPESLIEGLRLRFPEAKVCQDDPGLAHWVSRVVAFIEIPARGLDLPLDIQGTAFQQRVWKALQGIPRGSTKSYSEIATGIGKPTAARAVGRACASNRLAVVIPCHRAVRRDGGLGGYRWGTERKQQLLEREAKELKEARPPLQSGGDVEV
jgi:AraC family transcriptional regulator of adaptative response/methylated-DNA-[protein]-cysteine methyltransferase